MQLLCERERSAALALFLCSLFVIVSGDGLGSDQGDAEGMRALQ